MRILFICHRVPFPPNKGEKIRAFHQLKAIAARHEVDLFTLADDRADLNHRDTLLQYCKRVTMARVHPKLARALVFPSLLTSSPLSLPYFYSRELQRQVQSAVETHVYDRIFVSCSVMMQYVEKVVRIPIMIDLIDVDSDKWMQYAAATKFPLSAIYRREGHSLRRYEKTACEKASVVLVATEREAELARGIADRSRVAVVSNGVDTQYFDRLAVPPQSTGPAIVFTGDMSYLPNIKAVTYFAQEVLPLVRRSVGARFLIVGRNPSRAVQKLRHIGDVEVTGFVPDVRTYLARAQVAVAPFSIAAGIQNKILEAMAYGLPVVATPRVLQGLSHGVADVIATGDSSEALAEHIVRLLRDPALAERQGVEGRRRVTADYNWGHSLEKLLQLLEDPVRATPSKAAIQSSIP